MTHQEIVKSIEQFAPTSLQEGYDNTGWQVGNPLQECIGVLINLDLTDEVIDEAISLNCNLILTHHPLIFGGVKKIIGRTCVERLIIKAIKNDINIYCSHTNLDNICSGVNHKIASKLGLVNTSVLRPVGGNLFKLVVFVPVQDADRLRDALFEAGAGSIGAYSECSFAINGMGTFKPGAETHPTIGVAGGSRESVEEIRLEFLVPNHARQSVYKAMIEAHPYEEVAHDWYVLDNHNQDIGAGYIGHLPQSMDTPTFLQWVKNSMGVSVIRYTDSINKPIHRVAVCGGSGSFLLPDAIANGCDALITADFKYHQFFDHEGKIMILDIGHYESEQYTSEIFYDIIKDKFPNFAVRISKFNTNPVKYYF